ncbi:MAG: hypothetical protein PWR29_369, partial [Methanolobus sp.]|nr:hypothetical protein [Methanolobus sp.]
IFLVILLGSSAVLLARRYFEEGDGVAA